MFSGAGVLAEYVLLEADCVAVKPPNFSYAQAAGLSRSWADGA